MKFSGTHVVNNYLLTEAETTKYQWDRQKVIDRFDSCVTVFELLPNVVRLGFYSYWPDIVLTDRELRNNRKRINKLTAQPDAIDRAVETLTWIQQDNLTVGERKLIWLRGHRVGWKGVAREFGVGMRTCQRWYAVALDKIIEELTCKRVEVR
ncbi:DUF6362 family protein [Teredinibacter sp. KSP-S5-2]|uniref:DUF6362 family protein n=1 Tax=Teredinibacter sp. KSP-S5-2 TaxID=3034506 RepID=UPI0029340FEC|nr:DUF6362 family protein [Teredinibacter sp. KSP-S5-2]WNO10521.1 DUF6362 family protein [Teredinibacter sp. KSP-S5-2]